MSRKRRGDVAQLGERGVRNAEARSSILLISTSSNQGVAIRPRLFFCPFIRTKSKSSNTVSWNRDKAYRKNRELINRNPLARVLNLPD
jgi:hypothetical protein